MFDILPTSSNNMTNIVQLTTITNSSSFTGSSTVPTSTSTKEVQASLSVQVQLHCQDRPPGPGPTSQGSVTPAADTDMLECGGQGDNEPSTCLHIPPQSHVQSFNSPK